MLADSGYVSEDTFARADAGRPRPLAPLAKDPGPHRPRTPQRTLHLDKLPATAAARRRMQHPRGRDDYKMRARTVEPVIGQLKTCQKLVTMSRRGLTACESELPLACHRAQPAQAAPAPHGGMTTDRPVPRQPRLRIAQNRSLARIRPRPRSTTWPTRGFAQQAEECDAGTRHIGIL